MTREFKLSGADAVSRRDLLRTATLVAGGAAALATSISARPAMAGAMTQQAAGYQPTPHNGQQCDGCTLFQAPSSCKFVAGEISPTGWCRLYAKKSA